MSGLATHRRAGCPGASISCSTRTLSGSYSTVAERFSKLTSTTFTPGSPARARLTRGGQETGQDMPSTRRMIFLRFAAGAARGLHAAVTSPSITAKTLRRSMTASSS